MAETLAALFVGSAATGTIAATGATVSGAAAVAAAGAGTLSAFVPASAGLFGSAGALSAVAVAKGAFGVLSAASSIFGGQQQAQFESLEAEAAEVRGLEQGNRIRRAALEQQALNTAAARGAGLRIQGSAGRVEEELAISATRELSIVRSGTERTVAARRLRGRQAIRRGVAAGAGTLLRLV